MDPEYLQFKEAINDILEHKMTNAPTFRKYYYLNWFKQVKVYKDN